MIETEVKFRVEDRRTIKHKIESIGGKDRGGFSQLDIWYDSVGGALKSRNSGLKDNKIFWARSACIRGI